MTRVKVDSAHRIGAGKERIPVPGDAERKKADIKAREEQKERARVNRERARAIHEGTRILLEIRKTGKYSTHEECMRRMKQLDRPVWRAYVKANQPIEEV